MDPREARALLFKALLRDVTETRGQNDRILLREQDFSSMTERDVQHAIDCEGVT